MEPRITEIAQRIRSLRDDCEFSESEMAASLDLTVEEYLAAEAGKTDLSFTFLYRVAEKLGVDMIDLLTGEGPHLSGYALTRAGDGLSIKRRAGFEYLHLAPTFKDKLCEPFIVTAPFSEEEQLKPIAMSQHVGQEFNFVVSGTLKFGYEGHTEILNPGDSVLYDSSRDHGMIATDGAPCTFLAIVLKDHHDS